MRRNVSGESEVRVVCSWCEKKIRGSDASDAKLSHGLCLECKPRLMAQAKAVNEIHRAKKESEEREKRPNDLGWWHAIHRYVSPRERALTPEEEWIRSVAYGIKRGEEGAIRVAVEAMAPFIPEGAFVVPAPASQAGSYGGVSVLANELAKTVGGIYAEPVARIRSVPSSHERRRGGGVGTTLEEHLASMASRTDEPCPGGRPIVVVDNVATTGATLGAIKSLIGEDCDVRAIVWAEAPPRTAS